jgi:hypothetical protein
VGILGRASAAVSIAKVQAGPLGSATTGTLALTLPAPSTAHTLLVATLVYAGATPSFVGPAGWARGPQVSTTGVSTEIWYLADNAGSVNSASFSFTSGPQARGQLSEWSGVAAVSPLDQSGTASRTTNAPTFTVSTSAATTITGDLAITAFGQRFDKNQNPTFTPQSGWSNVGSSTGQNSPTHLISDANLALPIAAPSELETSTKSGTWAAAIATFKPGCAGGTLSLGSPSSASFPAMTLNGTDQSTTAAVALTPSDMTASGSGWNVQATSTTFTDASGDTLPTTATQVIGATTAAVQGNCSLPSNSVAYPITLPAAATAPTPTKLYNTAADTGLGPVTLTLDFQLTVRANARSGNYSSVWTFSIVSGP